eukprot:scaffold38719_cov176-Amphora_coffeaeformis.AAC.3
MTQQSLALCVLFSVLSGFVRVVATMVLAYPDFLEKQKRTTRPRGSESSGSSLLDNDDDDAITTASGSSRNTNSSYAHRKKWYLAAHLSLLLAAAILSILGNIRGPVSLAVPITTASNLLCNVAAMGIVLRMRSFDKAQRTGTYVVFFSVLSLMDVGPRIQPHQDAAQLLTTFPAILCIAAVTALMLWAAQETWNIWNDSPSPTQQPQQQQYGGNDGEDLRGNWKQTMILLVGMTMSNVGMATSSKTFATLTGFAWFIAFIYYVATAALGVMFSVVSSTLCDQGIFTPLASVALIAVNMMLGMIIWQDHKAVDTWIAYLCCACLMCCGVYLLAEIDLVDQYWRSTVAETVRSTPALSSYRPLVSFASTSTRRKGERHKSSSSSFDDDRACDAWQATLTGPPAAVWQGQVPVL